MKITGPSLNSIGVQLSPELQKAASAAKEEQKTDFGEMLNDKIMEVDSLQKTADAAVTDFATGKSKNLHEAVLAMEMADTSLRMAITVRNKVLEAYQEVMRIPV